MAELNDRIAAVARIAERIFEEAKSSHGWDHTLRVAALCRQLSVNSDTDLDVLLSAAYLHDIGRGFQDRSNGRYCHGKKSREMAEPILADLGFKGKQLDNILHAIEAHRYRNQLKPETLEAKILYDADKLDSIGAIGIARAFLFSGEIGARLHNPDVEIDKTDAYSKEDTGYREYMVKLKHVKDKMLTEEGKRLAEGRHQFMADFFQRFQSEYNAEL